MVASSLSDHTNDIFAKARFEKIITDMTMNYSTESKTQKRKTYSNLFYSLISNIVNTWNVLLVVSRMVNQAKFSLHGTIKGF